MYIKITQTKTFTDILFQRCYTVNITNTNVTSTEMATDEVVHSLSSTYLYTNVSVNVQHRKTIQPLNTHSTEQVCLYA